MQCSKASFFSGNNNPNEEIPVQDIKWFKDGLAYKRYGNATDYYEKILFSSFLGVVNKSVIESSYLIKKQFFSFKGKITMKNISKYISHMAPCIEVVGYRQKKKGVTSFGDLSSDFGANVKFLIGQKKKYKKINIGNLKTVISNKKINQTVSGNTGAVYISPLNSLRFVLNKLKKDKVNLEKDFYVFTGSTVGVVPILGKGLYAGQIDKLGSAKAIIH